MGIPLEEELVISLVPFSLTMFTMQLVGDRLVMVPVEGGMLSSCWRFFCLESCSRGSAG